jgi:hypothetical protein
MSVSFEFKQCITMHKPRGKKAKNSGSFVTLLRR